MPDSFSSTLPFVSGHRAADRFDAQLSMQVVGVSARTRNISATGVFFEAEVDLPVGSLANVNVPYVRGWASALADLRSQGRTGNVRGGAARVRRATVDAFLFLRL
jgi:hypothetical protein